MEALRLALTGSKENVDTQLTPVLCQMVVKSIQGSRAIMDVCFYIFYSSAFGYIFLKGKGRVLILICLFKLIQ